MKVEIKPHTMLDKAFEMLVGPHLCMRVDYDDVDQEKVDREAKKLKAILDEHWESYE